MLNPPKHERKGLPACLECLSMTPGDVQTEKPFQFGKAFLFEQIYHSEHSEELSLDRREKSYTPYSSLLQILH
jgi:hypothetical protein